MDGPYNINKCLIQDTIFRDYVDYYSIEKKPNCLFAERIIDGFV